MALLDDLFGGNAGANPLDQIRNGLLGDLLTRMKSGQIPGVGTQDIVAGMPQAGATGAGRFAAPNLTPPAPMSQAAASPVAQNWETTVQPAPQPQAVRPDFSPSIPNRMVAFGRALQGQDPGDLDAQSQVKNQTFDFLTRRGVSESDASAIISNPQLFKAVLPMIAGSGGKMEVNEIYDAEGRPQKVLLNPTTGKYQPIGGAKAVKPAETVSVGQKAVDRAFAKDYVEFTTGGFADAQKNLDQLRLVSRELTDPNGPNLTGWFTGNTPDIVNSVINPKAVDRRELVEEVVQRNLRLILGAQFTQREGDRLIARAFNPALDEKANAERLGRLIGAMEQALAAKQAAAQYYEQNGTLAGFQGQAQFSAADFEAALEDPAPAPSKGSGGNAPLGSAPPPPAVQMLRSNPTPQARAQFDEVFGTGAAARILGAQ